MPRACCAARDATRRAVRRVALEAARARAAPPPSRRRRPRPVRRRRQPCRPGGERQEMRVREPPPRLYASKDARMILCAKEVAGICHAMLLLPLLP